MALLCRSGWHIRTGSRVSGLWSDKQAGAVQVGLPSVTSLAHRLTMDAWIILSCSATFQLLPIGRPTSGFRAAAQGRMLGRPSQPVTRRRRSGRRSILPIRPYQQQRNDSPRTARARASFTTVTRVRPTGAHTENGLDVSAYRCVDVAGRNRQNSTASIFPVVTGCHPACAINNATNSIWFSCSL